MRRQPAAARHLALRALLRTRQGDPLGAQADWAAARQLNPSIAEELTAQFGPGFAPQ